MTSECGARSAIYVVAARTNKVTANKRKPRNRACSWGACEDEANASFQDRLSGLPFSRGSTRFRSEGPSSERGAGVGVDWELRESGPADAYRTVLLLPGGLNSAGSYAELMAQPALASVRLVAVTLPGHAGTPPPDDFSIENLARLAAELAADVGCDVVVGFSMGASVALEMAASAAFSGPVVLLGLSL